MVRGDHAAYLNDEEEDEDFFEPGAGTLLKQGGEAEQSADEIARKRDAEAQQQGGWLALKWLKW